MTFLAPLFLLGGLAITLPVLFHLIRRSSREHLPFSSLMFLTPSPPRITRKSRLENILLLLLRCAVIALLALAFARPFMKRPVLAGPAPDRKTVLLVDISASMRREGLWADATARALEAARGAHPGDSLALLFFDRATHTALSFEEWRKASPASRPALVSQRLGTTQPGWAGTQLGNALIAAAELLNEEKQSGVARQIVVISDFQEGARLSALQGFTWPKDIAVIPMRLKTKRVTNAGVQWLPEDATSGRTQARVRVVNSSESKAEQFTLQWNGQTNALRIYVAPGQSRTIDLATAPGIDRVVLAGDEADFDNTTWHVPARRQPVEVAVISSDAKDDPRAGLFYLERAFHSDNQPETTLTSNSVEQNLLTSPATDAAWVHIKPVKPNDSAGLLTNSSLVVISEAPSEEQGKAIAEKIRAGGTALWACSGGSDTAGLSALCGVPVAVEETPASGYAMFGEIDFTHPLFAPFADARFSDFTKIHFWKHRRVSFAPSASARVVAKFDDGSPAVAQFTVGKGTMLVLASTWQPADSQLALSSKFVPLLYSILEVSGAVKTRSGAFQVGDLVDLVASGTPHPSPQPSPREAERENSSRQTIRKPDGKIVEIKTGETSFADTDQPGIYSIGSAQPYQFAVNGPAEESRTAPMDMEELRKLGVPIASERSPSPLNGERAGVRGESADTRLHSHFTGQHAAAVESRQKLWRWLIAGTLVVLMLETWVAARAARRATRAVG